MRNASLAGQVLPPLEFPYHEDEFRNYSRSWPDYADRMRVISHDTRVELQVMLDIDKGEEDGTL
jgi:hypothetical protein